MKQMKKALMFLSLILCSLGVGLLITVNPSSEMVRAEGANGPNNLPAIVAISKFGETNQIKGSLTILGAGPLALDGQTINQNIYSESRNFVLLIEPYKHYEVVDVIVRYGEFKNGIFAAAGNLSQTDFVFDSLDKCNANFNLITKEIYDLDGVDECTDNPCEDAGCEWHNPTKTKIVLDDFDYQIEIEFALVNYRLGVTAKYFEGSNDDNLLNYFGAYSTSYNGEGDIVLGGKVDTVSLGETIAFVNTHNPQINPGLRFCYAEMSGYYNLEIETGMAYTGSYVIEFNSGLLDEHVTGGIIGIAGIYIETHMVTVAATPLSTSHIDSFQVHAESPVIFSKDRFYKIYYGPIYNVWMDKGTAVTIVPGENDYFDFDVYEGYVPASAPLIVNGSNVNINVVFTPKIFTINISAVDSNNSPITAFNDGIAITTNPTSGKINIFDKISAVNWTSMPEFINPVITIQRKLVGPNNEWFDIFDLSVERGIDERFLEQYLINGNEINIVVNFTKQCLLTVTLLDDNGTIEIWEVDAANLPIRKITLRSDNVYAFGMGTKIQIIATSALNNVFIIDRITGVADANKREDTNTATITVTLNDNLPITISFKAFPFELVTTKPNDKVSFDDMQYLVNETISFEYNLASNSVINNWKINGISYKQLGPDVFLSGNTLTIRLTPEFLSQNPDWLEVIGQTVQLKFNHDVQTGMKTELLLGILVPSVMVPLGIIIIGSFMLVNYKRKKLIKTQLGERRKEQIKRNIGGYVSDLREGNITGEITKEDIKKELKRQKEDQ